MDRTADGRYIRRVRHQGWEDRIVGDIEAEPVAKLAGLATSLDRIGAVIDVGAYRGSMATHLLRIFPHSLCFLFEPLPDRCRQLRATFEGVERVQVREAALSDASGEATFHVGAFEPTSSLFPRNTAGRRYYDPRFEMAETIQVRTELLDDVCAEQAIDHLSCLKIDTQGAELRILRGASGLLADHAIDIIYTEWFAVPHYEGAPLFDEIWGFLASRGYGLYDLFKGPHGPDGQLRYGDALFISERFRRVRDGER